jgi:uncharacterized protein (UPF0332 family)
MKEYDLQKLTNDKNLVENKINEFLNKKLLLSQEIDTEEIQGHILKAENNLRFVADNIKKEYLDWSLTGCYYACYHVALALIQTRGFTSKDHLATLCVIIKEFYKKELTDEDLRLFSNFLDYQDVLFYVESKNKREDATYSTKTLFDKKEVEQLRIKAILFVNKLKGIIQN